jgi:arylsulfatase
VGAGAHGREGRAPEGTDLTPINPLPQGTHSPLDDVRPWDSLSDDEKRLFARMAEVFAASRSTPTIRSGGSSTTSRSPASSTTRSSSTAPTTERRAKGRPTDRSTRTSSSTAGPTRCRPTSSTSRTSAARTPTTTTHRAGRSPSPRRTRCSSATPTRAARATRSSSTGPGGIAPRARCATSTTTSPTSSRRCWTAAAWSSRPRSTASTRSPLAGASMRYSFDQADAPTPRTRQYYCMLGTRGSGRRAGRRWPVHGPTSGIGPLRRRRLGALQRRRGPRRGGRPRRRAPDKLKQLIEVWFEEAGKYDVLPLDDRSPWEILATCGRSPSPTATRYSTTRTPPRCPRPRRPTSAGARSRSRRGRDRERRRPRA